MAGRRWPLLLLALPAAVAIWSGWVGLGEMAGFGLVHPLPGIADGFTINSAITLPVGMEAYAAYALGVWLSPRPVPARARRFACRSSLAALGLGLLGQVSYHLLVAYRASAPLVVVVLVACVPVLVLGAGAALLHLLGSQPDAPAEPTEAPNAPTEAPGEAPTAPTEALEPIHGSDPTPVVQPAAPVAELAGGPVEPTAGLVAELARLETVAARARRAAEATGVTAPAELAAWLGRHGLGDHSTEAVRSALRRGSVATEATDRPAVGLVAVPGPRPGAVS
jgi:hypothetical protein